MAQSTEVCEVMDELYEELTADTEVMTEFQVAVVVRAAAEKVVEEIKADREAMISYILQRCRDNDHVQIILQQCEAGAHRRNASMITLKAGGEK